MTILLLLLAAADIHYDHSDYPRIEGELIRLTTIETGHYLEHEAAIAYRAMKREAQKQGIILKVSTSFRSRKQQYDLYVALGPYFAAKPGNSTHEYGFAVDIHGTERVCRDYVNNKEYYNTWCRRVGKEWKCPTNVYRWLLKNAHKYGFRQTVSHEKWHWQYVGMERDNPFVKVYHDEELDILRLSL
jgi:D-alanyl-D-alanine carboxypeptidase